MRLRFIASGASARGTHSMQWCGKTIVLSANKVHQPACGNHSHYEHCKTIEPVADHGASGGALGDSKNHRSEHCEKQHRGEMGGGEDHGFLPTRMLWASTA